MSLTILLLLNCLKRAETYVFVDAVVYFADIVAVGSIYRSRKIPDRYFKEQNCYDP